MVEIPASKMKLLAPLFADHDETMVLSCLQGHMGRAWADSEINPKAAKLIVADFCFYAGDSNHPDADELVAYLPVTKRSRFFLEIPPDQGWAKKIEEIHTRRFSKITRYATCHDPKAFDRDKLTGLANSLKEPYQLKAIDREIYEKIRSKEWSFDLCSQFDCFEDYHKRGIGVAILLDGLPVCGASSYTIYDEGIEIEIDTHPGYRRLGLATVCAANLILSCLEKGIYPSWDAANLHSLALAEKLGYRFHREYDTYLVSADENCELPDALV